MTKNSDSRALAAVCLASLMFGLEISSVPSILPTLERILKADLHELEWTMNAYTIAVATVLMAVGTLADRYGRKRIFILTILGFGLTSLLCGLAFDMRLLIAGRALQGASGGAMLICQVAVLSHQVQDARARAKAFGVWGIVFGFGLGFGPIVGSGIAAALGWEWVFLIHAFIAVPTAWLAITSVHESKSPNASRLDVAGIAALTLAVFCFVFFITQVPRAGHLSSAAPAVLALALAIASLVAFVVVERVVRRPAFDLSVFRARRFSGALLGSVGMNFSFWPFMAYFPIWIQSGLGFRGALGGAALLAYTLPTLILPPFAERLVLRRGAEVVIPAGLFTIGLGFIMMYVGTNAGAATLPTTLGGALVAGVGLGATNTPVTNTTTASVSSEQAGMASGIDMSARMISLAVNIALMGLVLFRGVHARLDVEYGGDSGAAALGAVAERIAAGNASVLEGDVSGVTRDTAHHALAHGFGWVMLYGASAVWSLAILSFLAFNRAEKTGG